ncbi:MAG TPA: hypothetical protein VFU69_08130 [Ktedonobacterales bacterium]|nr:hypothetical protein [Ktedonobacterales bacterium]
MVPSPAIDVSTSTFGARLSAVAAVSATDIWAVGFAPVPGGPAYAEQTLIEHWDGTQWSIVPSPNPPSTYPKVELDSVFALASNDVWAVGFADNPSGVVSPFDITLIEHWDGTQWSLVPSPNPDPVSNELRSISGVASNDLWAVGERGAGAGDTCCPLLPLIEHWDGTSWSVVPNPGLAAGLFGVTALSATDAWAVGFNPSPVRSGDIIMHWDGTAWTNVAAPEEDANGDPFLLRAVTAVSATDVWAVGYLVDAQNNAYYSVTEHWDGTAWTLINLSIMDTVLNGVAASGPADAWAVDGSGLMQQQHWDGATWSVVSAPDLGNGSSLEGVVAISSGNVWAVGLTNTNGAITPLIEHFTQA